jgi:flagellar basal-body rod protein FlgC
MVSAIEASLSGLQASSAIINNSANNLVNRESVDFNSLNEARNFAAENDLPIDKQSIATFTPSRVDLISLENGGVTTALSPVSPSTTQIFSPDNPRANEDGVVDIPNVSIENELVTQIKASDAYRANIQSIKGYNETFATLLDIIG